MSTRSNIFIDKNTDFQTPLIFTDDDGPIDLSSYSFFAQIRKIYSLAVVANFQFHLTNPAIGEVEMYMTSATSSVLSEGKYQYDILLRHESGEIQKVVEGLVFIVSTVTQVEYN